MEPYATSRNPSQGVQGGSNLADILERVLDKGLVIAGDIRISLVDIELLTIKLRLIVTTVQTAQEMGIDWWRHDPWLRGGGGSQEAVSRDDQRGRLEPPD